MKKINFRQPKFIIPLIVLPFLLLGFFVYSSFKSKANKDKMTLEDSIALVRQKGINSNMPGVSTEISNSAVKDKFGAYKEAYKNERDYSALNALEIPQAENKNGINSSYSATDIQRLEANRRLDSLRGALQKNRDMIQQRINGFSNSSSSSTGIGRNRKAPYSSKDPSPEELLAALQNKTSHPYGEGNSKNEDEGNRDIERKPVGGSYDEQMRFFKDQIKMVDSMQKANKTAQSTGEQGNLTTIKNQDSHHEFDPSRDSLFKPLHVALMNQSTGSGFNTISQFKPAENIKAIIDEAKKVTAGARVRIRLLQDIVVGENVILSGTYIYGMVTGFQTQRVNISITNVNNNGIPLPVKLDVFDNDGYMGLYVPSSNFREFTKEIGTQATSGLSSIQTSTGSSTDIQTSLLEKVFSTTTNTVGKLIAQNKATLKSDYIIYLKENKSSK